MMYMSGMLRSVTENKVCGAEQPYHSSQLQQIAQYRRVQSFVLSQVYDHDLIAELLSRLERHRIRVDERLSTQRADSCHK